MITPTITAYKFYRTGNLIEQQDACIYPYTIKYTPLT